MSGRMSGTELLAWWGRGVISSGVAIAIALWRADRPDVNRL